MPLLSDLPYSAFLKQNGWDSETGKENDVLFPWILDPNNFWTVMNAMLLAEWPMVKIKIEEGHETERHF